MKLLLKKKGVYLIFSRQYLSFWWWASLYSFPKIKAYTSVARTAGESHEESPLAKGRKNCILESKFQEPVITTVWDFQELSEERQARQIPWKCFQPISKPQPAPPCHIFLALFPQISKTCWLCLFWMAVHRVLLRKSPSFPSWLTRKLFVSQLFPGGSRLPTESEGGCLCSWAHSPG